MRQFCDIGEKKIKISILSEDISEYKIVLNGGDSDNLAPNTTPKNEMKAAKELQKYFYLLTGSTIPIVYDHYYSSFNREIKIGKTKRSVVSTEGLGDDGYIIKTVGTTLEINGGIRGVLYGVYTFIEKYLGVRYFSSTVEKFVFNGDIALFDIDEKYVPLLEYRDIMFWNAWDTNFSVKQKINGMFCRDLGEENGYGVGYAGGLDGICHTFWPLVPKKIYFNEHPEYFALFDGKRNPDGLCLSNPDTFNVFVENLKKWLRAEREPRLVSVSVNDNHIYCQCPKCAAIDEREESHAGQVIDFVNRVADSIKDEFPLVRVDTLAYAYAKIPPKYLKPRDNVAVRVCTYITCHNHGLTCKEPVAGWNGKKGTGTERFVKNIKEWSNICDKIYIWDYIVNFFKPNAIYPTFHRLRENMQFFVENHAKGIYYEGVTETGEFCDLRVYILAKLAWNPNMSEEEYSNHIDEFLQGFYGEGWIYIKQFIDYSREEMKDLHFGGFTPLQYIFPCENRNGQAVYMPEFFAECRRLFDLAYSTSTKKGDKERIEKSSIQVDFTDYFLNMDYYVSIANEEEKQSIFTRNKSIYDRMRKYGVMRMVDNCELPEVTDFTLAPKRWTQDDIDAEEMYTGVGIL